MVNTYLVRLLLPILEQTLNTATPVFRRLILDALVQLEKDALNTPNPVDDILVLLLRGLMHIPEITEKDKEE